MGRGNLEKLSEVGTQLATVAGRLATTVEVVVEKGPPLVVRTIEAFERVGVALGKLADSVPKVTAQMERLNDAGEAWTEAWNSASELRSHPALDKALCLCGRPMNGDECTGPNCPVTPEERAGDHAALMEQHESRAARVRAALGT